MNENEITKLISENIKRIRESKKLLQAEVASKAEINSNYYAKVERGEAKPSGVTLVKIIKALGVKSTDILPV